MARKINYDNWSKEELVKELQRIKETKYGLVWHRDLPEEKIDVLINPDAKTPSEMFPNEMTGKPFPVLKEVKTKEIKNDKSNLINMLIEGDNYHSLAVLNFTHREAIDFIYIDPPYNTGNNDFLYNDKFVDAQDPYRHSKWLSFMERRLKLAKNLLKKTGVIFISIDDHEQAQLKLLCDEIFTEPNFIANLVWENREGGGSSDSSHFKIKHEYILVYAKSIEELKINKEEITDEDAYTHTDKYEKRRGKHKLIKLNSASIQYSKSLDYPIKAPDGSDILPSFNHKKACWRWSREKVNWGIKNGFIQIDKDKGGNWVVYSKQYLNVDNEDNLIERQKTPLGVISLYSSTMASKQLENIFHKKVFDYSKPYLLIEHLLRLATDKNAVVLDFMAGSGTTAHATLSLNKEDDGKRQFILCTNNENNICTDACYPRIKKIIKGYKSLKGENITGLNGNLKYYICDFVEAEPTDRNKRKLVNESTEMLCIKENTFESVQDKNDFKIFKNSDKYLGIIFYEEAIDSFKKAIKNIKGNFNVYVFSLGDDPHEKQFADVKSRVTLCAIPEVILKVYREIFK